MERLAIAAVLVVVAVVASRLLQRRRPAPPTQPRWEPPAQLDRADFDHAGKPWLVVVFTSATCESCRDATEKARVLASPEVGFQDVSWQDRKDIHDRYSVEVVPTTVMADADGVVRASFVGFVTATDLWAALAEARSPGASPEPGLGRDA
ncbi:MAG: TlpA family protein disulfide reductase [Actinomycetota bacterium]